MRQIFCFAFSVTFIAVYGQQDCNGDFVSYHSCVAQFRQNQLLNRRDANKINNDISQCFITYKTVFNSTMDLSFLSLSISGADVNNRFYLRFRKGCRKVGKK